MLNIMRPKIIVPKNIASLWIAKRLVALSPQVSFSGPCEKNMTIMAVLVVAA